MFDIGCYTYPLEFGLYTLWFVYCIVSTLQRLHCSVYRVLEYADLTNDISLYRWMYIRTPPNGYRIFNFNLQHCYKIISYNYVYFV